MKKAAFLDRDGTIIHDVGYLSKLSDVFFIPGAIDLLGQLMQAGYELVVVTNQSGVARGYFCEDFVRETHRYMSESLASRNITFAGLYYCPHHAEQAVQPFYLKDCTCRKPKPGMLVQAAQDHGYDLTSSLMIGDTARDLEAGRAAGCRVFHIDDALRKTAW